MFDPEVAALPPEEREWVIKVAKAAGVPFRAIFQAQAAGLTHEQIENLDRARFGRLNPHRTEFANRIQLTARTGFVERPANPMRTVPKPGVRTVERPISYETAFLKGAKL
jgi:hypothetical protein